ncbi:MAG: histidine kinase [Chitinophagaceae bacterium]
MKKIFWGYWPFQIGGWGLVFLSNIFFAYLFRDSFSAVIVYESFIVAFTGLFTTHLLRTFFKAIDITKQSSKTITLSVAFSLLPGLIFFSVLVSALFRFLGFSFGFEKYGVFKNITIIAFYGAFFIIPWVCTYLYLHYLIKLRLQQINTLKLNSLVRDLEIKTIRNHLNPHFIFNSLNSIRALIEEDSEKAKNGLTRLSNLLLHTTMVEKSDTIKFKTELELVKDYLALEKIRFEERLNIHYEIDDETLHLPVPPMLLQTLVENAVKHGISKLIQGGYINIASKVDGNFHALIIENSGPFQGNNSTGFGIPGARQRLVLTFGERASFSINGSRDVTTAVVRIPILPEKELTFGS